MSIARIAEAVENPSVTDILAAYPTKDAFDAAVRAGRIKPTTEAGIAANIFNRIVTDAIAKQAQAQAQSTVFQEMTTPQMGLAAAQQMPPAPQMRGGQGLDRIPVPEAMFDEQRMAGGGIVAFQAGGTPPSFANMFTGLGPDLDALAAARKAYMGDFPMESPEERERRRREENAMRLMEIGLGIAGGESPYFASNLKGALPGIRGAAEDVKARRIEELNRLAAERAEKGKVFEGVLGMRGKAAESAAAEARLTKELTSKEKTAEADRKARITAANIASGKQTDMKYYADQVVKAKSGDKEAQIIVEAIQGYLPLVGAAGIRGQAAMTSAEAGAEGKALGAYKEARATVDRMLGPLGTDRKLRNQYNAIEDPAKREAFVDDLVKKEMARAKAATEAFTAKGQPGGQPGAAATNKVPQGAVDLLKSNPSEEAKKQFDAVFGPGAAARALATK